MRLLFDHNLSYKLVSVLADRYADSKHVCELGMASTSDDVIWNYAQKHGMTIVSKDSDFYHHSMVLGHPPKVVWLRLGNCTTRQIGDLLRARYTDLLEFDQDPETAFLVLTG
jgi:predicted nuclease of predicted toxin-antitoxin system